jgi:hypothetical protein
MKSEKPMTSNADPTTFGIVTDTVAWGAGWRARLTLWNADGLPVVYECPSVDVSQDTALMRARVLASLAYSERQTLH